MAIITLHDKERIASVLQRNVFLHIYSLGDLDPFFWNYTTWYTWPSVDDMQELALLYTGGELPILLAFTENIPAMQQLLHTLVPVLPKRCYAHFSCGAEEALKPEFHLESHGKHYKMGLMTPANIRTLDTSDAIFLTKDDLDDMMNCYEESYPEHWFDPRMLATRQYFGIRIDSKIVCIAGIHVYSPEFKVASLGNITTHPKYRRCGYGKIVTARVCQSLLAHQIEHISLNVKADNQGAIALYRQLGFEVTSAYHEYVVAAQ